MTEGSGVADITHSNLDLNSEEKRAYGQLFKQADTEGLGVVTGDVAVKFFERTRLDSTVLGQIWQIADTENRGLLTPAGFSIVLRLIGHAQAGRDVSPELALRPGPLPRFDNPIAAAAQKQVPPAPAPAIQPQTSGSGGLIRVPPLAPDKINEYASLFDKAGGRNGVLSGDAAKAVFEKARLPNEVLGRIWSLSDTEQRGALGMTQFIIAMHLLMSMRSGALRALPQSLPPGLYEAAARRGPASPPPSGISRQFSGQPKTGSPLAGPAYSTQSQGFRAPSMVSQSTGSDWLVTPQDKAKFDQTFATLDKSVRGYITGDEAVQFFSNSGLSEDSLASIWDLADIKSEGQLNRDEFAVAMYLIRQQRSRRDGRDELPASLPPALIPPSMRQRVLPPQQPTAPAFDNAAFATQQPKSAADDLFGLDAMTSEPGQISEDTVKSENDPFSGSNIGSPSSPRAMPSPSRSQGTSFKPFIPTSSFGQGLATQTTGGSVQSGGSQSRGVAQPQFAATDDLLGDNDPEISNKFTEETTELGNMSNQIGQLRNQAQELQSKKSTVSTDLTTTNSQKRELEQRLAQFRAQYEQEVKDVKILEEQLRASRTDTRKSQQDLAMIEGTHQDLQNQHKQVAAALEADQKENMSLKERMRKLNAEVAELKPQLEKLRSDARQHKGLVAINKKQLATNEGERHALQTNIEEERQNLEAARSISPGEEQLGSSAASPALSVASQSTNPFFRRTMSGEPGQPMSPSGFAQTAAPPNQNTFDNIFGPSQVTPQNTGPPPTTFKSSEGDQFADREMEAPTPSSPQSSIPAEIPQVQELPPPPEPRQIGSDMLPLSRRIDSSDSLSSSVKANPPASRYEPSGTGTPTPLAVSRTPTPTLPATTPVREAMANTSEPVQGMSNPSSEQTTEPTAEKSLNGDSVNDSETEHAIVQPTPDTSHEATEPIPGAFPGEATTPVYATPTGGSAASGGNIDQSNVTESDPFAGNEEHHTNLASSKADFDSAISGMDANQRSSASDSIGAFPAPPGGKTTEEFPPIKDLGEDDGSDAESATGFDDDFTALSPQKNQEEPDPANSILSPSAANGTSGRQAASDWRQEQTGDPPPPEAQKSPPNYDQTISTSSNGHGRDSNQFPSEFGGLLPSREMSASSPEDAPQIQSGFLASMAGEKSLFSGTNGSITSPPVAASSMQPSRPPVVDEFDSAFDDLHETKPADDDEFSAGPSSQQEHDFDPRFDSPAPSKDTGFDNQPTPTGTSNSTHRAATSFDAFNSEAEGTTQSFYAAKAQPTDASSHDWDEIFSGLDNSHAEEPSAPEIAQPSAIESNVPTSQPVPAASLQRPSPPGRALSGGTEHDDPILKRLTGMGYARQDALNALEKYDYNIDKAADYLTSTH